MIVNKAKLYMDTVVDIRVVARNRRPPEAAEALIDRAFEAFRNVERACSRFSPDSELMRACSRVGMPVPLSPYLFEPLRFALEMAVLTEGALDPAIGKTMEEHGFNRHYLTKQAMNSPAAQSVTYRDIAFDERERTLTLRKPMVIDLGAVAKGFAVDLAAQALKETDGFVINAGGDLFAGGWNEQGEPWPIGIRHPEQQDHIIDTVYAANEAVCTSGSYARKSPVRAGTHHLIHPLTGRSPEDWVSCSVIAPFAMMADAFSTAAFLLGAQEGPKLIEQAELKAVFVTPGLQIVRVGGN